MSPDEKHEQYVLKSNIQYYKEQSHNRALHLIFLYGMALGAAVTFVIMVMVK